MVYSTMKSMIFKFALLFLLLSITGCSQDSVQEEQKVPENILGKAIFEGTCKACHGLGINGAPIFGNKIQWGKRAPQGIPTLVEHASNGYGLMPAKGGNESLTTEDITAAVTYMVENSR